LPVPGKTEIAWRRYRRKLGSLLKGLRRDPDSGMWVYSPLFLPKYSPAIIELNGRLLAAQVAAIRRWLGLQRPSAAVSMPTMTPAVGRLPWVRVVFERCDDFTTLPEADAPAIAALERRLLALSDAAAYVSPELMDRERGAVPVAELIGHGVDFARLSAARPLGRPPEGPPPAPLAGLGRPIVGFFGGMDDYRMDAELMVEVARHVAPRGGSLLLIGPEQMDLSRVLAEPNVRHVGQVAPEALAALAAHFDVGIIPFLRNEFNRLCSPVKLKEYLALGFPVVATDLPAYAPYAGLIAAAGTHDQFLGALDRALSDRDPGASARRRAAVAGDDWDRVAARMAHLLGCP
jgi:glycosyltransferase involved in cell wall biosynthesis